MCDTPQLQPVLAHPCNPEGKSKMVGFPKNQWRLLLCRRHSCMEKLEREPQEFDTYPYLCLLMDTQIKLQLFLQLYNPGVVAMYHEER